MKRYLIILAAAASLAMLGCSPNRSETDNTNATNPPVGADNGMSPSTDVMHTTPVADTGTTTMP